MQTQGLTMRLKNRLPHASAAEKNIISYIQDDPKGVIAKSIREIASSTYSSPSTIFRFCKRLGFDGYKDFQRELVRESAAIEKWDDLPLEGISPDDGIMKIIDKTCRSDCYSIEATRRSLDPDALGRASGLIRACRVADLFGIGASLLVAHDLAMKLMRVDKECHISSDVHNQLVRAKSMHPDDLAIAFSYSGATEEVLRCVRYARSRGCSVIAISRLDKVSPIADYADIILGVAANEPLLRSAAMASRLAQLFVVDSLYTTYVMSDYGEMVPNIRNSYIEKSQMQETAAKATFASTSRDDG